MDKSAIKKYAIWARQELIKGVKDRAHYFGVRENEVINPERANTKLKLSAKERKQRQELLIAINNKGYSQIMEEVAYACFEKIITIRYLEVNSFWPEQLNLKTLAENIHKTDKGEQYRSFFISLCNAANKYMPRMFDKITGYEELLFPHNLFGREGVLTKLISSIPEEDWIDQVEIIGWLYQYYNSQRRDQVINFYKGYVKKEDIPAATQLFTPDWIVRYMVDNSLGRYWLEHKPDSKLGDKLTYLVKREKSKAINNIQTIRPQDLSFFDPCMGSGHILIYAFDLLMQIYKEEGYKEAEAAREIIKHNLYGVDIDERCSKLAYFSLMMKARSFDKDFFKQGIEPNVLAIEESNAIKEEILATLIKPEQKALAQYLVESFIHAKEYGSLISVKNYDYYAFLGKLRENKLSHRENLLLDTLDKLARQAKILSRQYAIVCTNPPYLNKMPPRLKNFVKKKYDKQAKDLFSAYIFRNFDFCKKDGYCAFMTPYVWMFIKSCQQLREFIIKEKAIISLIQMEYSAFSEATVPICSFIAKNAEAEQPGSYIKLTDFRGGLEIQRQKFLQILKENDRRYIYQTKQSNFLKIPGSPLAYWANEAAVDCFSSCQLIDDVAYPRQGIATGNNKYFLKYWYEVDFSEINFQAATKDDFRQSGAKYAPYNKGGIFRKWYADIDRVIRFDPEHYQLLNTMGNHLPSKKFYFQESITWSKVTSGDFSARYVEPGSVFDVAGCSIFAEKNLYYILGMLNSVVMQYLISLLSQTINYEVGNIKSIPIRFSEQYRSEIETLVEENIKLSKADLDECETSPGFKKHPLIGKYKTIAAAYKTYKDNCQKRFATMRANEERLNQIFIEIYGLEKNLSASVAENDITVHKIYDRKKDIPPSMKGSRYISTLQEQIKSLISYAVGMIFGRYSPAEAGIAYAGGTLEANKYQSFTAVDENIVLMKSACNDTEDISKLFINWLEVTYGSDSLEENLSFIAKALGGKGSPRTVIKNYFCKDFFSDHLKMYKKRPIYWLLDSGKENAFKALFYLHRYKSGEFLTVLSNKIQKEINGLEKELNEYTNLAVNAESSERNLAKNKDNVQAKISELEAYARRVKALNENNLILDLDKGIRQNYQQLAAILSDIK